MVTLERLSITAGGRSDCRSPARFGAVKIRKEEDEPVRGGTASEADDLSHALLDAQKNARVRMNEKCDCFKSEMKHGAR